MSLDSAALGASADPTLQQGMSPTSTPLIEGETRGPDYGHLATEPLRDLRHEMGQQNPTTLPNGVTTSTAFGGTSRSENAPTAQASATDLGDHGQESRQIPHGSGTVTYEPSGTRGETGFVPVTMSVSGPGRDEAAFGAPIFPRFVPSPLPGQSPVSGQMSTPTRATAWLSRIGDYLQRTVEVTSRVSQGTVHHGQVGQWSAQEGAAAPTLTGVASPGQLPVVTEHRPPSSSGSAGISPELVQAEVARQLESAMGELHEQLRLEKRRTDEAMREAQGLRRQLDVHEMRVALEQRRLPEVPPPPPGLPAGEGLGSGVLAGVTSSQTPLVPEAIRDQVPVQSSGLLRGDGSRAHGHTLPKEELRAGHAGLDHLHSGAGVSGVTAIQTPSGPPVSLPSLQPRSQSPGPRAFFQGLFGRSGTVRSDRPSDDAAPVGGPSVVDGRQSLPLAGSALGPFTEGAPGVTSSTTTPEGNLLATLARGIESLLQQQQSQSHKADRPEAVKPGITDLPRLPEYAPTTGSIDLLNWLTHIQPIMQDLSDTSYAWWEGTLQDALSWYTKYSAASPLERLQLKPISSQALARPEWARVERRATAMMLSAVPQAVREEVIAMGSVTSLALLCKLYAVYQPGNLQEKALVLQRLERPDECDTALQAVEALRKWTLWRRRATSIGIAEPDASVLIQGLDRITTKVVKANSELSFRVSLIRSTLQVDVCPSSQSVTTFLQHLQAEMEQQARLGAALPPPTGPTALRALGASEQAPPSSATPTSPTTTAPTKPSNGLCRFFQGDKGCRRGNTCRYPHTWSLLEKGARSKKCLACGSTAHKVKECKAPGGSLAKASGTRPSTSGAGETGSTSPTAVSPENHQRKVNFEDDGVIQTKVLKLLAEVRDMPIFKSVMEKVREWSSERFGLTPRSRPALLDSGATHVLRAPKTQEEWNDARNVSVQLAGDSTVSMRQTSTGSLLSGEQLAQVIVPLGKVITTLGYKLCWTSEACELIGPQGEVLPLDVEKGCPEVSEKVANKLIQQLEEQQVSRLDDAAQSSVKAITRLKASWWSYLREYVRTGNREDACCAIDKASFLDFKDDVKQKMITVVPKVGIWELLKELRVNRRSRKRLLRADTWILRWDPPAVERPKDAMKHLSYIGDMIYVNMNTMLVEK